MEWNIEQQPSHWYVLSSFFPLSDLEIINVGNRVLSGGLLNERYSNPFSMEVAIRGQGVGVAGEGLWAMSAFGSSNMNGLGQRYSERNQVGSTSISSFNSYTVLQSCALIQTWLKLIIQWQYCVITKNELHCIQILDYCHIWFSSFPQYCLIGDEGHCNNQV